MDYNPTGPVRCNRCKAYMNPFVQFVDGGRRFVCNICSYSSEGKSQTFSLLVNTSESSSNQRLECG